MVDLGGYPQWASAVASAAVIRSGVAQQVSAAGRCSGPARRTASGRVNGATHPALGEGRLASGPRA